MRVTESFTWCTHVMIMAHVHTDNELGQGTFSTLSCLFIDVSKCCLFGSISLKDCLSKVKHKTKCPLVSCHALYPLFNLNIFAKFLFIIIFYFNKVHIC